MGKKMSPTLRIACVAGGGFLVANAIRFRRRRSTAIPLGMAGGFLLRSGAEGRMPPRERPRFAVCRGAKSLPVPARAAAIAGGAALIAGAVRRRSALSPPLGMAGGMLLRAGLHGHFAGRCAA